MTSTLEWAPSAAGGIRRNNSNGITARPRTCIHTACPSKDTTLAGPRHCPSRSGAQQAALLLRPADPSILTVQCTFVTSNSRTPPWSLPDMPLIVLITLHSMQGQQCTKPQKMTVITSRPFFTRSIYTSTRRQPIQAAAITQRRPCSSSQTMVGGS